MVAVHARRDPVHRPIRWGRSPRSLRAFTIGMCFQVSDMVVSSPRIRRIVLLHAILSFVYNTAILAFVLNLVFGFAS